MSRITSKLAGMQKARGGWLCLECGTPELARQKGNRCRFCAARGKGGLAYFPSQRELSRAMDLMTLESAGAITGLRFHPRYPLTVNGHKVATYVADASYVENYVPVVEDTKPRSGFIEPVARLKIDLFEACYHPLRVRIV